MAADHLTTEVVPALETALESHREIWVLKDGSPLRTYFAAQPNARQPNATMTPAEWIRLLRDQFYIHNCFEAGNTDILHIMDTPLQSCFPSPILYAPDLYHLCLPHVNIVTDQETRDRLKHTAVKDELYIESPAALLYHDPTAKFWIPPMVNRIMCGNANICYSWQELHYLFTKFFTTPNVHVGRIDTTMYTIHPTSGLADIFKFKTLHLEQIPLLMKHVTKYLGKTSTMITLCPKLKFTQCKVSDSVIAWLENNIAINTQHRSPHTLHIVMD